MTDEQIIKAFELCINLDLDNCPTCCYFDSSEENEWCSEKLFASVLDLINRQKANLDDKEETIQYADKEIKRLNAEIERLVEINKGLLKDLQTYHDIRIEDIKAAKSEAIKEFWSRLKADIEKKPSCFKASQATVDFLNGLKHRQNEILNDGDNLVKEMVGE